MNPNIILCLALILSLLLTGCATHRQPRIAGRWQVSGMGNVVTLTKDHSARLTSDGNTTTGSYRMGASDLLLLTLPSDSPGGKPQTHAFFIHHDDWSKRTLHQPNERDLVGRWTVLGTDYFIVISEDHAARFSSDGKTSTGSYRMAAPDILVLTLPGITPASQPQNIPYFISAEDWANRTLHRPDK